MELKLHKLLDIPKKLFSSPEHKVLKVSYCDHFVYTLASTVINQSVQNLIKRYRAIRSRVSSNMGVIRREQLESIALDFVYTVASTNINQLVPK